MNGNKSDNDDSDSLCSVYKSVISEGNCLLLRIQEQHKHVGGIYKLCHKIRKDISCLSQALDQNKLRKEHIGCCNLYFYKGIIEELQFLSEEKPDAVLETFSYKPAGYDDGSKSQRLTVDIVSDDGRKWTKIIARNPLALQHIYKDGEGFGKRTILDQAKSYIQAANQNLHHYSPPQVIFSFINGVPEKMKLYLENIGVTVKGNVLVLDKELANFDSDEEDNEIPTVFDNILAFPQSQKNVNKLNICVSTMIAFVSALTNGSCHKKFSEPLLNQQAEAERSHPIKPLLNNVFEGKRLIACSAAIADFKSIIEHVGGKEERLRAKALLSEIEEVPNVMYPELEPTGRIKRRSLEIFGTGHHYHAITITANKGFVNSAKQKGANFAVIIHESRALTEVKELPE